MLFFSFPRSLSILFSSNSLTFSPLSLLFLLLKCCKPVPQRKQKWFSGRRKSGCYILCFQNQKPAFYIILRSVSLFLFIFTSHCYHPPTFRALSLPLALSFSLSLSPFLSVSLFISLSVPSSSHQSSRLLYSVLGNNIAFAPFP